jgi:amylosucrase
LYNHKLHLLINELVPAENFDIRKEDKSFYGRFMTGIDEMDELYKVIYPENERNNQAFHDLLQSIVDAHMQRPEHLRNSDEHKQEKWFLSHEMAGISLYVDRFCGNIINLNDKLGYFKKLGVNFVHLMPVFESPEGESDGGYAISDFRKVDPRFGSLEDLRALQEKMSEEGIFLMIDIVLNHTSHRHEWAEKARSGDKKYQHYFYMYDDRVVPDAFEQAMPEIFPESAPGSFTYIEGCDKWVMTVFHSYQWDLNYSNPEVLVEMMKNIFFYANLGVDILRIDAPAFIWKQIGTKCQNLPQAHTLLRLIKLCVETASPGMALLGEAIVAPAEIMKYFGMGEYTARECDVAYNATHMALQWDALATGDTRIMLAAQHEILKKPFGTTWISYTRCHDDIGLGYDDNMIEQAGFNAFEHRKFLKEYYSGDYYSSPARGALFSVNPRTQDARISGSLASLCGLEKALEEGKAPAIKFAIDKILMMQAHSFFIGGIPVIFYGDEVGYTNDYSYLQDPGKNYDNRWMHRPLIDWGKNKNIDIEGTVEHIMFFSTRKLLGIRKEIPAIADLKNLQWLPTHNIHIAAFLRSLENQRFYGVFNFSGETAFLTWYVFKEWGRAPGKLFDHWKGKMYTVGQDDECLIIEPYGFCLLEDVS